MPRTVRVVLPAAKPVNFRNGSHLVQLGLFSSAQGARRARQRNVLPGQIEGLARMGKTLHAVAVIGFGCGGTLGHDAL